MPVPARMLAGSVATNAIGLVVNNKPLERIAKNTPGRRAGFATMLDRQLAVLNGWLLMVAAIAVLAAAIILSESVFVRYALKASTDWQDEAAILLLTASIFLTAPGVQQRRGHVAIEAVIGMLSPGVERVRRLAVDIACAAFCGFFSWKSWTLFHEAVVEHQLKESTWAYPLWMPYSIMAFGMTLLTVQICVQIAAWLAGEDAPIVRHAAELGGEIPSHHSGAVDLAGHRT